MHSSSQLCLISNHNYKANNTLTYILAHCNHKKLCTQAYGFEIKFKQTIEVLNLVEYKFRDYSRY